MAVKNASDSFDIGGELTVHRLGFGAVQLTGPDAIGDPEDVPEARALLRQLPEVNVDFIDTADSYGPGVSEQLIGEVLGDHEDVVVATKTGFLRDRSGNWTHQGHPEFIRNQVMCSLDRLRTDIIDLYQFHRPDPDVSFEESVTTFAELKDAGLVRHVGLSNVTVGQLECARDHVEVATVQNRYNLADREHEDVLNACEDMGIGFIPWHPLAAGNLNGTTDVLNDVAAEHGATRIQVALAWLLERSPVILPIPGTSTLAHLEENVAAASLNLDNEEIKRLGTIQD